MSLVQKFKEWRQPKPHPVTGDMMTVSERATWKIMGQYRKWRWFFALQLLTVIWWIYPQAFPGGLFGWNLVWSDLAIVVEQMVGIAFLNQMWRDAKVIRLELSELREDTKMVKEIWVKVGCDQGQGK